MSRVSTLSIIFCLAILAALCGRADARMRVKPKEFPPYKWDDVSKSDWDIVQDTAKEIFNRAVIFERVIINDSDMLHDNNLRSLYRRIRILTNEGRSGADVEVPFIDLDQRVVDVQGRTILPDGSTILLNKDQIMDKTVLKAKGVKINQKSFSLPGVTDNCIIEYEIQYELPHPASDWFFQADMPLLYGQLRWIYHDFTEARQKAAEYLQLWGIRVEDYWTRNFVWQRMTGDHASRLDPPDKPTQYIFEVKNVPPLKKEPFSPSEHVSRSGLVIYYGSERIPLVFWSNSSAALQLLVSFRVDSCDVAKKLAHQFDSLAGTDAKIHAAYKWVVQHLVNMSYRDLPPAQALLKAHPVLESKANNRPDELNDVFKHGYADRSDINMAFLAILRAMGIDAKEAAITDRTRVPFMKEAKYWQFDDYCVTVKDGSGAYHFYSPGDPYLPCGLLPSYNEGGTALIEGREGEIVSIPYSECKSTSNIRQCQYTLSPDLSVAGSVLSRLGGQDGRNLRLELINEEGKKRDTMLRKVMAENFPERTFDSLKLDDLEDADKAVQVTYRVKYPPVTPQGDRLLLDPFDYLSTVKNPFEMETRTLPVQFQFAYHLNESAQISLPEGWKIEALPHDTLWENAVGTCGIHIQEMGDGIFIQRIFDLKSPYWEVEQYPAVKELYQKRQDMSHMVVVLIKAL